MKALFAKFNLIDFLIVMVLVLGVIGIFLVKAGKHQTSSKIITSHSIVEFDVMIKAKKNTSGQNLFKKGDFTFITIRNVPYTKLKIVKSEQTRWKTIVYSGELKPLSVDDPSAPYTYNYLVTLEDKAIVTKDGVVVGGNKIKIGLPISLEGFKYRLGGVVSDVRVKE